MCDNSYCTIQSEGDVTWHIACTYSLGTWARLCLYAGIMPLSHAYASWHVAA